MYLCKYNVSLKKRENSGSQADWKELTEELSRRMALKDGWKWLLSAKAESMPGEQAQWNHILKARGSRTSSQSAQLILGELRFKPLSALIRSPSPHPLCYIAWPCNLGGQRPPTLAFGFNSGCSCTSGEVLLYFALFERPWDFLYFPPHLS